jgi:hypothetical protein
MNTFKAVCRSKKFKSFSLALGAVLVVGEPLLALPPPQDVPEEVLRGEIITGARSPIDGKPMTAAEYAQLQAELATAPPEKIELSPAIRKRVSLLRLRKILKTILPFLPI